MPFSSLLNFTLPPIPTHSKISFAITLFSSEGRQIPLTCHSYLFVPHQFIERRFHVLCSNQFKRTFIYSLQCKGVSKFSGIETLLHLVYEGTLDLIFSEKIRYPYGVRAAWWGENPPLEGFLGFLTLQSVSLENFFRKM